MVLLISLRNCKEALVDNSNEKKTFLQEVVEHDKCGTDECCQQCDTSEDKKEEEEVKK
jgi:hypothetical protein